MNRASFMRLVLPKQLPSARFLSHKLHSFPTTQYHSPQFFPYALSSRIISTALVRTPRFSLNRPPIRHMNTQSNHPGRSSSPQDKMKSFLGQSDPSTMRRVDNAAHEAERKSSSSMNKSTSSGFFYRVSRLVFAFEAWTIMFFAGCLGYYMWSVMKHRSHSPTEVAKQMWDNFMANTDQYRDIALGRKDLKEFREEFLRDHIMQHPNDAEAKQELAVLLEQKKLAKQREDIRLKQESKAMEEFQQLSQEYQRETQNFEIQLMQDEFKKKMAQIEKSGKKLTDQDLLDFLSAHNQARSKVHGEDYVPALHSFSAAPQQQPPQPQQPGSETPILGDEKYLTENKEYRRQQFQ